MNRLCTWLTSSNRTVLMAATIALAGLSAGAQTPTTGTSTTPALTPAQQRAQARAAQQAAAKQAAEEKRQAAQQAAEEKRQAAQQAAANKKAGTTTATTAATTPRAGTTAANTATTLPANAATAKSTSAATGTANSAGNNKSTGTTAAGGAAVGSGTLAWGPRVYTSTGCTHNGNSAVCTFTFVNQGNEAQLNAGGAGELSGIQLVDDAHVPHRWDGAHFLDKYGTQQPRLIVQQGDTGTYVVTFPNVNPQVSSAEFHLRNQIIGGITFSGASSTTAAGTAPTGAKEGGAQR